MGGSIVLKKYVFRLDLKESREGEERKGKDIPGRGAESRKGSGTQSGKYGTRNLEAERIRRWAESTGGRMGKVEDSHRDKTGVTGWLNW